METSLEIDEMNINYNTHIEKNFIQSYGPFITAFNVYRVGRLGKCKKLAQN